MGNNPPLPRIGVDLMGCETPPRTILRALIDHPPAGALISLFGTEDLIEEIPLPPSFSWEVAYESIGPEENPLTAVRLKKRSSLVIGVGQIKEKRLDAFISAGNTGALMTTSFLQLSPLPGIDRPALLALIPTKKEPVAVIDVGASIEVSAANLYQFAQIGIAYQKARGIARPRVGLLNIGEEKIKGTQEHVKAYELLEKGALEATFIGNIEGRDVFKGEIDVLITDGFTGNVFLKTSEGIAAFILEELEKLGPLASVPGLNSLFTALRARLHFGEYPGALLCGVEGIVMKCHGASTPEAFLNTITSAAALVRHDFLKKLRSSL